MSQVNNQAQNNQAQDIAIQAIADSTIVQNGIELKVDLHLQRFRTRDGKKRDETVFYTPKLTTESLLEYTDKYPQALITVLNDALLQQAKKLFLDNGDNWDYIPSTDEYNLVTIANDLTAPRSGGTRIMTNANIELFCEWYKANAGRIWQASDNAINSGIAIFKDRFKSHIGNKDIVNVFIDRFTNLSDTDIESMSDIQMEVLEGFVTMLTESLEAETITVDDI